MAEPLPQQALADARGAQQEAAAPAPPPRRHRRPAGRRKEREAEAEAAAGWRRGGPGRAGPAAGDAMGRGGGTFERLLGRGRAATRGARRR